MAIYVYVVSRKFVLTDFVHMPDEYRYEEVGFLPDESWSFAKRDMSDSRIQLLHFIVDWDTTIFNSKQAAMIHNELVVARGLGVHSELLDAIQRSIDVIASDAELYLKFEYE